jgi:hypothetical protein
MDSSFLTMRWSKGACLFDHPIVKKGFSFDHPLVQHSSHFDSRRGKQFPFGRWCFETRVTQFDHTPVTKETASDDPLVANWFLRSFTVGDDPPLLPLCLWDGRHGFAILTSGWSTWVPMLTTPWSKCVCFFDHPPCQNGSAFLTTAWSQWVCLSDHPPLVKMGLPF